MISKTLRTLEKLAWSNKYNFSSVRPSGNLYMWGGSGPNIGYKVPATQNKNNIPKRLEEFDGNVVKVSAGVNHTAVVTNSGDLFTFGSGDYGMLGHGDEKSTTTPKRVEFFEKNKLKVIDAACGENHTIALTDDGDVWTWGMGGKHHSLLVNLFFPSFGALGHGNNEHKRLPTPVEALRKLPPVTQVTSGANFASVLNAQKDVYGWGRGEFGVFGNGSNKNLKSPEVNDYIIRLREDEKLTIKEMKSVNTFTMALMSDDHLYAWGSNEAGQLGVKTEIGIELYETASFPSRIHDLKIKGKKIVDFSIGENISVFLTSDNEVYWMGLRLAYEPERLKLPADLKVKKVGACEKSVAVVMDNGTIYMKNEFMKAIDENLETGVLTGLSDVFQGKEILKIGGGNKNRYAIVKA